MTNQAQQITLIGAGPVGSLCALYLAQRGYHVTIYEKRPDMRTCQISAGRSINLALANRGIFPLEQVGLMDKVNELLIPMKGRMIHDIDGHTNFQAYGQRPHEVIYSISRRDLNILLMNEAEATGKVTIKFNQAIEQIDFKNKTLSVTCQQSAQTQTLEYQILIGADGSGSQVRALMHQAIGNSAKHQNRLEPLDHSYKELTIPAGANDSYQIEKQALHIWPRGEYMLIALPNVDGSFTVTLFLPNQGENSFAELTNEAAVKAFFNAQFSDALALIPDLTEAFFANPTGHLATVRSSPWHFNNNCLLIGDAAHGIVPFHGQGMNCGFEDACVLNELLAQYQDDWLQVLPAFDSARKPNGDAIADLALDNYIEMRKSVQEKHYLQKKALAFELEKRHPERFIPRYSMVMFHRLPYSQAKSRGEIQNAIMTELLQKVEDINQVDMALADKLIIEQLSKI